MQDMILHKHSQLLQRAQTLLSTTQTEHQVEGGFLLDIVVSQSASIL